MLSRRTKSVLSQAGGVVSNRLSRSFRGSARRSHGVQAEPLENRRLMTVTLGSHSLANTGGDANSGESSISADGRYVVFRSSATNLVAGDANALDDIFRLDTTNGTIQLVSVGVGGAAANGASTEPSVSADGRYVGFRSSATNLTGDDFNGKDDVFLRDMQTGTTVLVSKNAQRTNSANEFSAETYVSADGRYVAFSSFASNLVANDTNDRVDSFLWDRLTDKTTLISATPSGATGNGRSFDPAIAVGNDGKVYTSFRSEASDLTGNDGNGKIDVFSRVFTFDGSGNVAAATTQLISVNAAGTSGNGDSTSNAISSTGRFVVFRSGSSDLAANDNNNADDVFLRDLTNNTTRLLSVNQQRTGSANGISGEPSVSTDGRFAAFTSSASNLVAGDTNGRSDIFFTDLNTGVITLLSLNTGGQIGGNGRSFDPFVSSDGRFVSFTSLSSDLTSGVSTGNAVSNIYVASTASAEPGPDNPNPDPNPPPTPGPTQEAPSAAIDANNLPPITGSNSYDFKIDLADNNALNVVDVGSLVVRLPDGTTTLPASLVKVVGSGKSAVATYRVAAPSGGTWTPAVSGNYIVEAPANAIKDASGNTLAAGAIGTLALTVAPENAANLVPTLVAKLPASQLAGGKSKASASVAIVNQGQTAVAGPISTTFYLSTDGELDAGDVQITTVTKALKLAPGKGKAIKAKLAFPANVDDGQYVILARVDSANGVQETNEFDNFVASSNSVTVAKAFVDLVPTPGAVTGKLTAGGKATALVTLVNNGNVPSSGVVSVGLVASTNGVLDDSDDIVLGSPSLKVSLKPGVSKTFKVKLTLPAGLAAGTYVLGVKLGTATSETAVDNNNAIGSAQFVIG